MASVFQVCIVGFPIAFLTSTNSKVTFIIMVSMIFVVCIDVLGFVFVPKIRAYRHHKSSLIQEQQDPKSRNNRTFADSRSKTSADSRGRTSADSRGLKFSISQKFSRKDLFHPKNEEVHAKIDELSIDEKAILNKFLKSVADLKNAEERKKLLESRLLPNDMANGNTNAM